MIAFQGETVRPVSQGPTVTLGRVVQKPVNANPGLKVNLRVDFSCIKMFFTAYVLCSLRLFKPKTKEQTI